MLEVRGPTITLIFLLILSFFSGKWQTTYRNNGQLDPLSSSIQYVILPFSRTIDRLSYSVQDFTHGILNAKSLSEENRTLKSSIKLLQLELHQSKNLESQVQYLKTMLQLKKETTHRRAIPAEIIGFFPYEHRATLSAGSNLGIEPGLAVITPEGLIGIIQSVTTNTSQMSLITSPNLQIGAKILKDPPYIGLIRGESPKTISMELLDDKATVNVNDLVETSGLSEKIPPHIPIGKVIHIESNPDFGVRKAQIFLNTTPGKSKEVLIIK